MSFCSASLQLPDLHKEFQVLNTIMTHAVQLNTSKKLKILWSSDFVTKVYPSFPSYKKRGSSAVRRVLDRKLSVINPAVGLCSQVRVCWGQHISMTDLSWRYSRGVNHQRLLITVIKKNASYDSEDDRRQQITPDKQRERRDAGEPSEVDLLAVNQSGRQSILLLKSCC